MPFGLNEKDYKLILDVFALYPKINEVIIFGSRAMGTEKPGSDIDLAMKGENIVLEDILSIKNRLEELPLAYKYDVIDYTNISNPELIEHVDKHGVLFYRKEKLADRWKSYRIEELAEKVGIGPFGSSIKVETFVHEGIPVISGAHLKGIRLEDGEFNFITEEHAEKLKNANVYRGDVIFTHAGNIGSVAFIPENSKYERYILSQRQFYLRCDIEKLSPEFITYFFKSPIGQKKLLANASSVGVPSIAQPVSYLRTIEVDIPEIKEQHSIASILSSLDDKIELNRQMNQTLEAIAQAIFKEWFVNFNFPNKEGKPYRDSGGKMEDGLPKGWDKGKLGDVLELIYGKALKSEERVDGKYLVVGSSGVVGLHTKYLVEAPGIVIGRKGTIGQVIWLDVNFYPIDTTFYIKDAIGVSDLYYHYFILLNQEFKKIVSDSAVPGLNRNQAMECKLNIPPLPLINTFNQKIKPLFERKKLLDDENTILTTLRDSILPRLMSGKIEVKV